jgi:hypothetical protein
MENTAKLGSSSRVYRRQLDMIEYLQAENRVLKERLGGRRLRFTDAERRGLARKGSNTCRNEQWPALTRATGNGHPQLAEHEPELG